jgi:Glycosyl transferases group 1
MSPTDTSTATVAIVSVGDPRSPATWSGTTVGLLRALSELGVRTQSVDLRLPRGFEQALLVGSAAPTANRFDAEGALLTMFVRGLLARRRLAGGLAGAIQIGTSVDLGDMVPFVTLEDMTLRQGMAFHPVFSRMSSRGSAGWERRRGRIYSHARMCAVSSHWTAQSLVHDYGLPPERVAVVGLGANHEVEVLARSWEQPRFLFVGIDWERKGGPLLLRAFARVREIHPQATLDVVGGHPEIDLPGVVCHGVLSQDDPVDRETMAELFRRATCLVVPSSIEPFGIVYVEAAAAGLPSIVSGEGGARDIVGVDGGEAVRPGDEDGLVGAMLRIAEPDTARRMGEAARQRSGLYTWVKVAERLLRILGLQAGDGRALAELL